jgi:hypothetical protein
MRKEKSKMTKTIDELVDFIAQARAAKKHKGISIGALATLLFSGALDPMFPSPPELQDYFDTYQRLTTALQSVAKLAKKRKGELIGLIDVKDRQSLAYWRHQVNPLDNADFIRGYEKHLDKHGFVARSPGVYERAGSKQPFIPKVILHSRWSEIMAIPQVASAMMSGAYQVAAIGIIVENSISKYGGNKERMNIKLYTGAEETENIILWSKAQDKHKITDKEKERFEIFSFGLFIAKVNEYRGKPSFAYGSWLRFTKDS